MAKFKRLLTEEQLNAIAAGRVQGVSLRGISRSTGIPYETVRDAAKRPDVVKVVESVQADIAADESRTTDAVREKRKRETSAKSSAKHRASSMSRATSNSAASKRGAVAPVRTGGSADGRILGVYSFPAGPEGYARDPSFKVHYSVNAPSGEMSEDDWRAAPREVIGRASVRLANCTYSFVPADEGEAERVARLIAAEPEVEFVPFADLVAALKSVRPGSTFTFEPYLTPAELPEGAEGYDPAVYERERELEDAAADADAPLFAESDLTLRLGTHVSTVAP